MPTQGTTEEGSEGSIPRLRGEGAAGVPHGKQPGTAPCLPFPLIPVLGGPAGPVEGVGCGAPCVPPLNCPQSKLSF